MSPINRRDRYSENSDRFIANQESVRNDDDNSFRGLLLGILLALLCGGGITALFLLNKNEEAPTSVISPVAAPSITPSSPAQPTTKETTIIRENTREIVPVPQATSEQPNNINITVPDSQPSVVQPPQSEVPSSDKTTQTPITNEGVPQTDTGPTSPSQSPQAQ